MEEMETTGVNRARAARQRTEDRRQKDDEMEVWYNTVYVVSTYHIVVEERKIYVYDIL